jgi:hypothetical protein
MQKPSSAPKPLNEETGEHPMTDPNETVELEIRRKSQELAVAWRKGRAAFVLDNLSLETSLRGALIATLIHDALSRWDPYDSKWATGFRRALLTRSQGEITPDEICELEREYSRQFGSSPPALHVDETADRSRARQAVHDRIENIRTALRTGEPIIRDRTVISPLFLRSQAAPR